MLINCSFKNIILLITIVFFKFCKAQDSFNGQIKYDIKVQTTNLAPKGYKDRLIYNYGNELNIYFLQSGNYARKYLNTGKTGYLIQFYFAKKGKLITTYKNNPTVDTLNLKENTLDLIDFKKIKAENVMGFECDCVQYTGLNKSKNKITLTYCFSEKVPSINPELFSLHKDYFLSDFFSYSKKPYLKFVIETDQCEISFIAKSITEKSVSRQELFSEKKNN